MNPNTIQTWIRIYKRDDDLWVAKRGRPKAKGDENINYKEKYEIFVLDTLQNTKPTLYRTLNQIIIVMNLLL